MSSRTPATKPAATATSSGGGSGSYDNLLTKLVGRGISLTEFAHVDEKRRKRMLKDDYQELKDDAKWQYDEPIELSTEVYNKEAELKAKK